MCEYFPPLFGSEFRNHMMNCHY